MSRRSEAFANWGLAGGHPPEPDGLLGRVDQVPAPRARKPAPRPSWLVRIWRRCRGAR